jgi:hypothetical protein
MGRPGHFILISLLILLISTITVQLCTIITASLDSGPNSDPESGQGLDSEAASDGCSGLYIPLLDAPQVAPLIIPQWRRPDRRDRGAVLHDVTLPPADFDQNVSYRAQNRRLLEHL